MLQAVITTNLKPDKCRSLPSNYRPISLLNSDIKIYIKALALRLLDVLPSLVHLDQVFFFLNCQALDATRWIHDILKSHCITQDPLTLSSFQCWKGISLRALGVPGGSSRKIWLPRPDTLGYYVSLYMPFSQGINEPATEKNYYQF